MRKITLTKSDLEFARRHGLTNSEMHDYIEDMVKEEEMMYSFYQMQEKEERDNRNSPQSTYIAW